MDMCYMHSSRANTVYGTKHVSAPITQEQIQGTALHWEECRAVLPRGNLGRDCAGARGRYAGGTILWWPGSLLSPTPFGTLCAVGRGNMYVGQPLSSLWLKKYLLARVFHSWLQTKAIYSPPEAMWPWMGFEKLFLGVCLSGTSGPQIHLSFPSAKDCKTFINQIQCMLNTDTINSQ